LYDGLILSTVGLGPQDLDLLKVDYPVVILGERIFDGPVDHVAMPNVDGSDAAVSHLVDRGCRRVLILEGPEMSEVSMPSLRFEGYRRALARAGIEVDPDLVVALPRVDMEGGRTAIARTLAAGIAFDAVFCVTDTLALGALRGLADAGIRVPDQVKLVGFDNIAEGEYSTPSLTSVAPDHEAMARTAVDLLLARILSREQVKTEEFVSPFELVIRESTGTA
jgi:DNA-binding LacI/PurR family transcriptional regulator